MTKECIMTILDESFKNWLKRKRHLGNDFKKHKGDLRTETSTWGGGRNGINLIFKSLRIKWIMTNFVFTVDKKFYFRYWRRGGVNLEIPFPPELSISISEHSGSNICINVKTFWRKSRFFSFFLSTLYRGGGYYGHLKKNLLKEFFYINIFEP